MSGKKRKTPHGPFEGLRPLRDALQAREAEAPQAKKTPPAPARSTAPAPEDDALVLHRLFAGVEPLDRSRGRVPKQVIEPSAAVRRVAERGAEQAQAEAEAVHEQLRALVDGGTRFEVTDDGARVEGRRLDVPLDQLRRLRRGLLPIDAQIDLHGKRVDQARAELELFLRAMRARGERNVLVIHGKGEHSPLGAGVLRGEMAAWLSQGASSQHVAAFATARREDGGEGAVYVLIRR